MASFNYYGELLLANRYDKSAWAGDMGNMAVHSAHPKFDVFLDRPVACPLYCHISHVSGPSALGFIACVIHRRSNKSISICMIRPIDGLMGSSHED
jgi:hypothetical protein